MGRRELLFLTWSMSSVLISIASSRGRFASSTTMAVISLVMEAMGACVSAFLEKSVWPVVGSKTKTPVERTLGSPSLVSSATAELLDRECMGGRPATATVSGRPSRTRMARTRFTGVELLLGQASP